MAYTGVKMMLSFIAYLARMLATDVVINLMRVDSLIGKLCGELLKAQTDLDE